MNSALIIMAIGGLSGTAVYLYTLHLVVTGKVGDDWNPANAPLAVVVATVIYLIGIGVMSLPVVLS